MSGEDVVLVNVTMAVVTTTTMIWATVTADPCRLAVLRRRTALDAYGTGYALCNEERLRALIPPPPS
jgi:hypothetical protein